MLKYIYIETVNDGKALIPVSTGLLVVKESATSIRFYSGDSLGMAFDGSSIGLVVTGTGFTQGLVDNINSAIVQSLQSNYRAKAVAVEIPAGNVVNDFEVNIAS